MALDAVGRNVTFLRCRQQRDTNRAGALTAATAPRDFNSCAENEAVLSIRVNQPVVCSKPKRAANLLFDITDTGVDARTLGFSLRCAAFGIDSTIFVEKCEGVAHQTTLFFNKVLAYATAHELGHVLLGSVNTP